MLRGGGGRVFLRFLAFYNQSWEGGLSDAFTGPEDVGEKNSLFVKGSFEKA